MAEYLTRSDYDILLLHILKDPKVFNEFCAKAKPGMFDHILYVAHDFIGNTLREVQGEYNKYPNLATIRLKFQENLDRCCLDPDVREFIRSTFDDMSLVPDSELCPSIALDILQKALDRQVSVSARDKLLKVLEQGEDVHAVMRDISADINKAKLGLSDMSMITTPLKNFQDFMIKEDHFTTGVDFFDTALDGGPWRHDLLGLLAPSSGGKTTMGIQVGTSYVRQALDRHCILLTYEQPLEGDIMTRVLSSITGVSTKALRGKLYSEVAPEIQAKLVRASAPLEDRLHVVDLSRGEAGFKGIDDIYSILRACNIPKEGAPTLVIIDWFLPCIQRAMIGAGVHNIDNETLRGFGNRFMDQLKILKNTENVILLITHQLNPTAGTSGSAKKPDWADAAEWKAFAWFMDICFAIGVLTEENIAWFVASKTRTVGKSSRLVKLHGEYCRFSDAESDYMLGSGGKIVPKVNMMEDPENIGKGRRKTTVSPAKQSAASIVN
jgi:hypothetical protein